MPGRLVVVFAEGLAEGDARRLGAVPLENVLAPVPDFIDEAPFNPWALVRDTLLSMRMRILCIKYLDMQATGSPSERERAIVCFWRAAPGEAGDVRYVERGEL